MKMYQDERKLDFHALGREIKRKREAKGLFFLLPNHIITDFFII